MLRMLADMNFNGKILRGVARRSPNVDIVRAQDVGLSRADDPTILGWAADNQRAVLTHDVRTMTRYALDRVRQGLPMPGVFEVRRRVSAQVVIEEIVLLGECSLDGEWEGQVLYLPF